MARDGDGPDPWATVSEYEADPRWVVVTGKSGHKTLIPKEPLDWPAAEPGQRPLCRDCGGERHEHAVVPTPREGR